MSETLRSEEILPTEESKLEGKKVIVDVVCSYCQKVYGHKESLEQGATHGVCPECYKKLMEELENEVI